MSDIRRRLIRLEREADEPDTDPYAALPCGRDFWLAMIEGRLPDEWYERDDTPCPIEARIEAERRRILEPEGDDR